MQEVENALARAMVEKGRLSIDELSIILDEPDIKMEEVKVEQVILNRYGKRAIRLEAWGKTVDNRQINMEMENNMHDDVKK